MQVDDQVIFRYFELLSRRPAAEVKALEEAQAAGGDPRKTKALFAAELIERLHSREAADRAAAEFAQVYAADAVPDDVPAHTVPTEGETLWIARALVERRAREVEQRGEASRGAGRGGGRPGAGHRRQLPAPSRACATSCGSGRRTVASHTSPSRGRDLGRWGVMGGHGGGGAHRAGRARRRLRRVRAPSGSPGSWWRHRTRCICLRSPTSLLPQGSAGWPTSGRGRSSPTLPSSACLLKCFRRPSWTRWRAPAVGSTSARPTSWSWPATTPRRSSWPIRWSTPRGSRRPSRRASPRSRGGRSTATPTIRARR